MNKIKIAIVPIMWIGQNETFEQQNKYFNKLLDNGYRPISTSTFTRNDITYAYHILEKEED